MNIEYCRQAELSLAAYVDLTPSLPPDIAALQDNGRGFSAIQAAKFSETYEVEAVYSDSNGLSATVFSDAAGNKYLAIRGTNDLNDLLTDIVDIALLGTTRFQSQYASLKPQVEAWIADGTLSDATGTPRFTVTGHSLGGFLATAIAADFGTAVSHAYLYNSPGVGGLLGGVTNPILSALGITSHLDPAKVSNIKAVAGPNLIAGVGYQVSPAIAVEIEDQAAPGITERPAALNHSQQVLTDALAVHALFAGLDPTLTQARLNMLIDAGGTNANDVLESALDALRRLLLGFQVTRTPTVRNDLYANLYGLRDSAIYQNLAQSGNVRILTLDQLPSNGMVQAALQDNADGMAWRYALKMLNPFAVVGVDYGSHNGGGALDVYDPETRSGEMTGQYIADRAEFLARKVWFNTNELQAVKRILEPGDDHLYQTDDTVFIDEESGYAIAQGFYPETPFDNIHRYYFGDGQDNEYTGGGMGDRLYGGGGADTLDGGKGNDYLEGNAGADTLRGGEGIDTLAGGDGIDTYKIDAGGGVDVVFDADGEGVIKFDEKELEGKTGVADAKNWLKLDENSWFDRENGLVYRKVEEQGKTRVFIQGRGRVAIVEDWVEGGLGIDLGGGEDGPRLPVVSTTMEGDHPVKDLDDGLEGIQFGYDENANLITEYENSEQRQDILHGTNGNDAISGLTGTDYLNGKDGNDVLAGGADADALAGGQGDDVLYGEGGNDILLGDHVLGGADSYRLTRDASLIADIAKTSIGENGAWYTHRLSVESTPSPDAGGNDWIEGGAGDDLVCAGGGDDYVDGGEDSDAVFGEGGNDIIFGGSGDDDLAGDDYGAGVPFGNDYLNGGAGNDHIWGTGGNDFLDGGIDDDWLMGDGNATTDDGDDVLLGGEGNDHLFGGGRADVLIGGSGDDTLVGDDEEHPELHGADYLDGGIGNDTLLGGGADVLLGGGDVDRLEGGEGDDLLDGGEGADTLIGGEGNDTYLNVGAGDTILDTRGNNRIILSGVTDLDAIAMSASMAMIGDVPIVQANLALGSDASVGLQGFFFGSGRTTIASADGAVMDLEQLIGTRLTTALDLSLVGNDNGRVFGGASADTLRGANGDDVLTGHKGNDVLLGGAGDDTYIFGQGDGEDSISDRSGDNVIRFGAGITKENLSFQHGRYLDSNWDYVLKTRIAYGTGSDSILVDEALLGGIDRFEFVDGSTLSWAEAMLGQSALDIQGGEHDDQIFGTGGGDTISGGGGNDVIAGQTGDDYLSGGAGDDTYVFNLGDGFDSIEETDGTDKVVFGEGLRREDMQVSLVRSWDGRQRLNISFGEDTLSLIDGHLGTVEQFIFADGSVLQSVELLAGLEGTAIEGSESDDLLSGSNENDTLRALGGNDTLYGLAGDDLLLGGMGDDALHGGDGNDDLLGQAGNDSLTGGSGRDVYHLALGIGRDVAYESAGETSLIEVGTDLVADDIAVSRIEDDLRLEIPATGDSLTIAGYFSASSDWRINLGQEETSLADFIAGQTPSGNEGPVYDRALALWRREVELAHLADLAVQGYVLESDGNYHRYQSSFSRYSNSLTHWIDEGVSRTVQEMDAEYAMLDGSGLEQISFDWANETVGVTSRTLQGTAGRTEPQGQPIFIPASGSWSFSYPLGSTIVGVTNPQGNYVGTWIYPSGNAVEPDPADQQLTITSTTSTYRYRYVASEYVFGSGDSSIATWGPAAIDGGGGNDEISAGGLLYGNDGNDRLTGSSGRDLLIGGEGADIMDGAGGMDRYFLENEYPLDLIVDRGEAGPTDFQWYSGNPAEFPQAATELDVVLFPDGVTPDDLSFSWNDELVNWPDRYYRALGVEAPRGLENPASMTAVLTIGWGEGYGVRIAMPHSDTVAGGIEIFRFADGTELTREQILARAPAHDLDPHLHDNDVEGSGGVFGHLGDDTITGSNGADYLDGGDGEDHLIGAGGDDRLGGGRGADVLEGGDGNDVLGFGALEFWGDGNTYRGGSGSDLLLGSINEDVYLFDAGDGDDTISDYYHADSYERSFGSYTDVYYGGPAYYAEAGIPDDFDKWNPVNSPYKDKDVIRFGQGISADDVIAAQDGADLVLDYSETGDSVRIQGWFGGNERPIKRIEFHDGTVWETSVLERLGVTVLTGTASEDELTGTEGNDEIFGLEGNDLIDGNYGDDLLDGGEGADDLIGGDGDDILIGGHGDDRLWGGSGGDTFVFQSGHGADWIEDFGYGEDVLLLGNGLTEETVAFRHEGDDLVISIVETGDSLSLRGWFYEEPWYGRVVFADGTEINADEMSSLAASNNPPQVFVPLGAVTTAQGADFLFEIPAGTFSDFDNGDLLSYSVELLDGGPLPDWLRFDAENVVLSGTPGNEDVGEIAIRVNAVDMAGESVSDVLTITVENINDAPIVISGIDNLSVVETETVDFTVPAGIFSDIDIGDQLVLTASLADGSPLPEWLSFDPEAASFFGAPGLGNIANLTVRVTATDLDGAFGYTDFNLAVQAAPNQFLSGTSLSDVLVGMSGDDTLDGGKGADKMSGGKGDDTYIVDNATDVVSELTEGGFDTVHSTVTYTMPSNVEVLIMEGNRALNGYGNAANDIIVGNNGINRIWGRGGDDLIVGEGGIDTLYGEAGNDFLIGGEGSDLLDDSKDSNFLAGGGGIDVLVSGRGNDVLAPGAGILDVIVIGGGQDVLLFNRGDGSDLISSSTSTEVTLSLGGGIKYSDLALTKFNNDLRIEVGSGESLTFTDWYRDSSRQSVVTLQMIVESSTDFDTQGDDPLSNHRVQTFDFTALVGAYDQARQENANLIHWSLVGELTDAHLAAYDTAAVGGDLAYQYGKVGSFASIGLPAGQQLMGAIAGGDLVQALKPSAELQAGMVRLG